MEPIANCDILNAYLSGHEPGDKVYQMIVSSLAEKFPPTLLQFQVLKVLCRDPSICKALFEQKVYLNDDHRPLKSSPRISTIA